jgi:two-component system phosphate regulon sensor histidine kinase PhoR
MHRASLLGKLLPPLLLILVFTLVLLTIFTGRSMRGFVLEHTRGDLEDTCRLLIPRLNPLVQSNAQAEIQQLCLEAAEHTGDRLTVILPDGKVVGDSRQDPEYLDNHKQRPEVQAALTGVAGHSLRYSTTLNQQLLYVALPGKAPDGQGRVPYVVRASVSMESLSILLRQIYGEIIAVGLILLLLAAGLSLYFTRRMSRKLQVLREGAMAFSRGDLDHELDIADPVEVADVAHSMNSMARQLEERIRKIEAQRQELAAVLASMVEGVIAVDRDENVIRMNQVAGRLLETTQEVAIGRSIQEVGRNSSLTAVVQKTLADHLSRAVDIELGGSPPRVLEVQASSLLGLEGLPIGALLVFNDVSRIRRLQTMRKDFVANVSHELKTPITSIKGFVETLLESPPEDKAELDRFLGIINRQADRLGHIISDLLALSRLEQSDSSESIEFFDLPLRPILERVVRDFQNRQPAMGQRLRLECGPDLRARLNGPLLEQAVTNLVDNALKYGAEGTAVVLECHAENGNVCIDVVDEGQGIGAQHLPRIFERFYRVDKARSRQMGGTGLGLAIVKHIAQAHGGHAAVTSEPGVGSTFTIMLPREVQK